MFEVVVKLKEDWIDISGVVDVELFKALSDWSSGKEEIIKIGKSEFRAEDIVRFTILR